MLDIIIEWDHLLFRFIHQTISNPLFDALLPWMREPLFWVPLYVFLISFAIFNFGRRGYWFILFIVLTVSSSDIASSQLVKKNIKRLRPCNNKELSITSLVRCGSGYSFTSSHAANHFAIATFLTFTLGIYVSKVKVLAYSWASIISLSQVYVGVHFPLDIFFGSILGMAIGWFWAYLFIKYYGNTLLLSRLA